MKWSVDSLRRRWEDGCVGQVVEDVSLPEWTRSGMGIRRSGKSFRSGIAMLMGEERYDKTFGVEY